jgi:hypothetical protein
LNLSRTKYSKTCLNNSKAIELVSLSIENPAGIGDLVSNILFANETILALKILRADGTLISERTIIYDLDSADH